MFQPSYKKIEAMGKSITHHTSLAQELFTAVQQCGNEGPIAAQALAGVITHVEEASSLKDRQAELLGQHQSVCDPYEAFIGVSEREVRKLQQSHTLIRIVQQGQNHPVACTPF